MKRETDMEMRSLAPVLAAARQRKPLSREEERALALRAQGGDLAARDELVARHLPLVVSFARKQSRGTLPLDELVQEGNLGLVRALEKFDPDAGTRFSTYAVWWIRAYVWRYLKQARSSVRPRSGTVARADLSLDALVDADGDASFLDAIEDEGPRPDDRYASAEASRHVRGALERVRGRIGELGWDIIHSRLQADAPDTLETIGRRWGVSRERVRQVETQTKQFLLGYLSSALPAANGAPDPDRQAA